MLHSRRDNLEAINVDYLYESYRLVWLARNRKPVISQSGIEKSNVASNCGVESQYILIRW